LFACDYKVLRFENKTFLQRKFRANFLKSFALHPDLTSIFGSKAGLPDFSWRDIPKLAKYQKSGYQKDQHSSK
jgi:hypothetical protein